MKESGIGAGQVIRRNGDGGLEYRHDELSIEEPLEIRIGGKTIATTMRTPGADEELAAGFLVAEAIIQSSGDIVAFSRPAAAPNRENVIQVQLAGKMEARIQGASRLGMISSSCGLCGKEAITAMSQQFPVVQSSFRTDIDTILSLPALLCEAQTDFSRTGGIHAAAIFHATGRPLVVREDIGRHNAVDKAIGRAFLDQQLPLSSCLLLVSGRASFEIVQKALAAGVPVVASVSAPSQLAMEFARRTNQTLIGFLRPPSFNIYSHAERIIFE